MSGEEVDGFTISTGAQFFDTTYRTALGLAGELGVRTGSLRLSGAISQQTGGARRVTYTNLLLMRLYSPRALRQAVKLMSRLVRRKGDLSAPDYARLLDLDIERESFADFGARHGGRELVEEMCDPLARSMVLAGPDRVGTVFGLRSLWSSLGNPFQSFRNPDRGVGSFASALSQACAEFTRLSTPVERVVVEGGVVRGVVTEDGFQAAAVVCATTATAALRIIPDLPDDVRRPLSEVTYSSCCHVVFGMDDRCLPKGVYLMVFPQSAGFSLASLAEATAASPGAAPAGKSLVHAYFAEESSEELFPMGDEEIAARAMTEIRRAAPAMPDAPPLFARVYRWQEAVCLSPGGTLSAMHRLRTGGITGADGLFLAGEYTDIPGVEGSLKSGVEAAESVARHMV